MQGAPEPQAVRGLDGLTPEERRRRDVDPQIAGLTSLLGAAGPLVGAFNPLAGLAVGGLGSLIGGLG